MSAEKLKQNIEFYLKFDGGEQAIVKELEAHPEEATLELFEELIDKADDLNGNFWRVLGALARTNKDLYLEAAFAQIISAKHVTVCAANEQEENIQPGSLPSLAEVFDDIVTQNAQLFEQGHIQERDVVATTAFWSEFHQKFGALCDSGQKNMIKMSESLQNAHVRVSQELSRRGNSPVLH